VRNLNIFKDLEEPIIYSIYKKTRT